MTSLLSFINLCNRIQIKQNDRRTHDGGECEITSYLGIMKFISTYESMDVRSVVEIHVHAAHWHS